MANRFFSAAPAVMEGLEGVPVTLVGLMGSGADGKFAPAVMAYELSAADKAAPCDRVREGVGEDREASLYVLLCVGLSVP